MAWWQHPDDPDYFSDDFLVERTAMEAQLKAGTETRLEMEVNWDDPLWVRSEHLELKRKGSQIYWILRIRLGWEKTTGLTWAASQLKPKVRIEWEKETWELKIEYPDDYPFLPPRAIVQKPKLRILTPHIWRRGALCLFNPKDGREYGWNPNTGTAVTIAFWATEWIRAYLHWKKTDVWPGKQETVY